MEKSEHSRPQLPTEGEEDSQTLEQLVDELTARDEEWKRLTAQVNALEDQTREAGDRWRQALEAVCRAR